MRRIEKIVCGSESRDMTVFCGEESRQVLVWFHGGGLEGGRPEDYAYMAPALQDVHTDLALPGYRFLQEADWPACIEDGAASLARAKELWPGKKLLAGGSSAGAYLAMMLCFDREYLAKQGMAPGDISGWIFNAGQPTGHYNVLKHGGEDSRLCRIDRRAPLYFVENAGPEAPILILCAENDMACRVTQNRLLAETLAHFGRMPEKTRMTVLPGYTHCGYDFPGDGKTGSPLLSQLLAFVGGV